MTESGRYQIGDLVTVRIETLVFSGPGLARTPKGVVFVDFAAPGDQLQIKITETKKNFARGEITKILEPSPERQTAPCPVFGKCGGCDWQHLPIQHQLKYKFQLVSELFRRELGFESIEPVQESPQEFNYRNRIQLTWDQSGPNFRSKRSHDLVPVQNCLLAEDTINKQLQTFRGKPGLRYQLSSFSEPQTFLPESSTPLDFSQVNQGQNMKIKDLLRELITPSEYTNFIDLYCGAGNFSFFLSKLLDGAPGVGVEGHPASVTQALNEAHQKKLSNHQLSFLGAQVQDVLSRIPSDPGTLLFIDPPRDGCSPQVSEIISRMEFQRLFYLSCDPVTQVRDLKIILKNKELRLEKVIPFDMFPQTSHCEVLVSVGKTR